MTWLALTRNWYSATHLSGDEQAFNQLVERHTGRIYNLAYRILLDRPEAEDIVQETFLRAYQALPHSQADRPFRPWLTTIARTLVNDPAINLADEPAGNLDTKSGEEIMRLLLPLNQERGTDLVIVTHDPEIAEQTQRIIHIRDGLIDGKL